MSTRHYAYDVNHTFYKFVNVLYVMTLKAYI